MSPQTSSSLNVNSLSQDRLLNTVTTRLTTTISRRDSHRLSENLRTTLDTFSGTDTGRRVDY